MREPPCSAGAQPQFPSASGSGPAPGLGLRPPGWDSAPRPGLRPPPSLRERPGCQHPVAGTPPPAWDSAPRSHGDPAARTLRDARPRLHQPRAPRKEASPAAGNLGSEQVSRSLTNRSLRGHSPSSRRPAAPSHLRTEGADAELVAGVPLTPTAAPRPAGSTHSQSPAGGTRLAGARPPALGLSHGAGDPTAAHTRQWPGHQRMWGGRLLPA